MSGGYAVVDVDDETGQGSGDLQFKTFLSTDPSPARGVSPLREGGQTPNVPYSPFNIAYYQVYFDVDTSTVLKRVGLSMIPREGFLTNVCEGSVDLYGPFWTLTTLILTLYTTSTLSSSLSSYWADPTTHPSPNLPLLSTATSLVYAYGLAAPALLWLATRYLGVAEWGLADAVALYGYAMAAYVPVSLLCLIPVGALRWALVGLAAISSGYFLVRNIYPILASADNKLLRLVVVGVVVLHAAMALAMKVLFFSYSVAGYNVGPDDPISSGSTRT
ncbi:hypothetical protein Q5752_002273 [Cryptotrichosporon argae]